jgi:hypothetical protein
MTLGLTHQLVTLNSSTSTLLTLDTNTETEYDLYVSIQNTDNLVPIYLGDSTVSSTSYGHKLFPGQVYQADLKPREDLYAISDSDSPKVAIIRIQR